MFLKVAKILSVKVAPYINSAVSASLSSRRVRLEKNKKVKEESLSPQEESVESTVVMSSSSSSVEFRRSALSLLFFLR